MFHALYHPIQMGFSGRFSLEPIPSKIGKIGNWKQTYTNTEHPGISTVIHAKTQSHGLNVHTWMNLVVFGEKHIRTFSDG